MTPEITIRPTNCQNNYRGYLNKEAVGLIDAEEIVFDANQMRLRRACFDDNKTAKICRFKTKQKGVEYTSHCAIFGFTYYDTENIAGKFKLEKDEDEYIYILTKNNQ